MLMNVRFGSFGDISAASSSSADSRKACRSPGTKPERQTRRLNTRPEVKDRLRGFLVLAALIATLAVAIDFVFLVRIAERSRSRSVRSNKFLPAHCVLIQAIRATTRESSLRIEDRLSP
jgi:hypothetical protein